MAVLRRVLRRLMESFDILKLLVRAPCADEICRSALVWCAIAHAPDSQSAVAEVQAALSSDDAEQIPPACGFHRKAVVERRCDAIHSGRTSPSTLTADPHSQRTMERVSSPRARGERREPLCHSCAALCAREQSGRCIGWEAECGDEGEPHRVPR